MACERCRNAKAIILRSRDRQKVCKECFYELFEDDIHQLIVSTGMFPRGSRVGIGISGGKDSTVLAYVLEKLNRVHDYGLDLVLLCVDEGIAGYRDASIATVHENQKILDLKLKIVSYDEIFGLTMDEVVGKIGKRGNCTYCGVFRRQALEEAARRCRVDCIVTGHNADDMAETVVLNFLRGDISRMRRCTSCRTNSQQVAEERCDGTRMHGDDGTSCSENHSDGGLKDDLKFLSLPRCKPFKYTYQKEIVFYAYFKKLPYFSTECTYAPGASRGDARNLIKSLEKIDSGIIYNIIKGAEEFAAKDESPSSIVKMCRRCTHPTSSADEICTACNMVEKLSRMALGSTPTERPG